MKNRTKDIIKLLILSICMIVEFIYFLVAATTILFYEEFNSVPELTLGSAIIVAIISLLLMCISVSGILTIKKGNKTMLFSDLLMKIVLIWIAAGFISFAIAENMYVSVFIIISGIIVGGLMAMYRYSKVKKNANYENVIETVIKTEFEGYNIEWARDLAAEEYCKINGKLLEDLTIDEYYIIFDYVHNPIAYFFAWVIKNDLYSELFALENDDDIINEIKKEKLNPMEILAEMEYVLHKRVFSEQILPFVNSYYVSCVECIHEIYSKYSRRYWDDYYEVIRNDNNNVFLIDFSWDIYHQIEDKINNRNKYYLRDLEEDFSWDIYYQIEDKGNQNRLGKRKWYLLDTELLIEADEGVTEEYAESCMNHLNNLSDLVINDLCEKLIALRAEEIPEVEDNKIKILDYLHPHSLKINTPHDNDTAYIVICEYDFEQEHGLAWSMRGDDILEMGYICDVGSPWNYENELAYKISNSIRDIKTTDIDSNEKAFKEIAKGTLKQINLIHTKFDMDKTKNDMVFVPPIVADLKNQYDIMIESLFIRGMVTSYECNPTYKGKSVVPSELTIKAKKDGIHVFVETIHIW